MTDFRAWLIWGGVIVTCAAFSACSSPEDVARDRAQVLANNARALAENDEKMARAQEWNVRVLGMPASGALTIACVALAVICIAFIGYLIYRHSVKTEELRNEREGNCAVCGATPDMRRSHASRS